MELSKQTHEAACRKIGREETQIPESRGAGQCFGGEVATAHSAFHSRGPARCRPVSSQKNARPRRCCAGTMSVDSRTRGIGCIQLFDHGGLYEMSVARGGKEFADLTEGEVDDLGARFVDQRLRGAYDEFDVASGPRD